MLKRATISILAAAIAFVPMAAGIGRASSTVRASTTPSCNPPPPPPMPPASDFVAQVDNKYFPLEPGTTFLYRGQEDGEPELDRVTVTDMTKTILGVEATVVHDVVAQNGRP